jgi:bla regulator protein blaR1
LLASTPIDIQVAVGVRSSPGLLEPGVVGVLRPVLLLPEDISKRLSPFQLQAVLAHELSHIRRRDNLTAAIHMVVEAVFWFHPFVWWIGARLIEERVRACDEAVLNLGGEPRDDADAIVSVCKLYVESPLTCVSGISGADLKKRIVRIMARHVGLRMSLGKKLVLAVLTIGAVAGPVAFGLIEKVPLTGQILQATGPVPSFEVASIRPDHSGALQAGIESAGLGAPNDRFIATNITIKCLLCWVFSENSLLLPSDRVSGGPSWIDSERYDIDAKLADSQVAALDKLSPLDRVVQTKLMVQSLLADRFGLVVKNATETRPVYALVIAKGGHKLHEPVPGSASPSEIVDRPAKNMALRGEIRAHSMSISTLAHWLSGEGLGRPVLDQTGLKGEYEFDLKWTPDLNSPGTMPEPSSSAETAPSDTSGPSIFTAVQEQLGLKLEPSTGPEGAITIVHIEKPSPN